MAVTLWIELVGDARIWRIDAESCRERGEVVLLLYEDLADRLAEGVFVEFVALLDAAAVLGDGLFLVFEIEVEHVFGLLGGFNRLGFNRGHAAEIVDVAGDGKGVGEFFSGVDGELSGNVHVLRSLEDLRVIYVGDDGLVFAGEIFVEEVDEFLASDGGLGCFRHCSVSAGSYREMRGDWFSFSGTAAV